MQKKNGFTLIELLAVIVILAIIALIAVPQILNILNKARLNAAKDSTYGIVKAAETYATNFMLENNGSLPHDDIEFACDKNGCNLITELTGYNLTGLSSLSFKGTKPTSGKVIISNNGKEITADLTINSFKCIYPSSDGIAECEGTSGDTPVTPPTKPELIKPTATPSPSGYSQSKTVIVNFIGEGTYLVMPTVNVTTNIEAVTCRDVEDASFTCDGETINTNGTLIANTWYKVESNPTLTIEENGSIYYKVSDGTNYKDGGSTTITEIDRTAPTVASVTQKSATTNSITVTASGTDNESSIVRYQFSIDNETWVPSIPQTSNEYTFNDLQMGVAYSIKVRVINETYINNGQNELNTIESSTQTITTLVPDAHLRWTGGGSSTIYIPTVNQNSMGMNNNTANGYRLDLPYSGYSFDWSAGSSAPISFCTNSNNCSTIQTVNYSSGSYKVSQPGYISFQAGVQLSITNLKLHDAPVNIVFDEPVISKVNLKLYSGDKCFNNNATCQEIPVQNSVVANNNIYIIDDSNSAPYNTRQVSINGGEWESMTASYRYYYLIETVGTYNVKVRRKWDNYYSEIEEFNVTIQ